MQKPYSTVSIIYNKLMRSVDYNKWAEYIYSLYKMLNIKGDRILELAAGNLEIANGLTKYFNNIIVSDLSPDMLKLKSNPDFMKVCCDMVKLPFTGKFDFIYSTFDSINYLYKDSLLNEFFENIYNLLDEDSCLTFDVSLSKNSLKHERKLNRKGRMDNIKYIQRSKYDKDKNIHYNYFKIKLENGEIVEELHKQKIYDFYYYFEVIEKFNMYVVYCFDTFTFDDASQNSERAQFIVKRKK